METELQLLHAINNGERAALRRLYDRYAGYAMSVSLRYIPQQDDVHDVMQDSFVKILTTIQLFNYRGEGSLKSWICRIVANQSVDFLREHKRFMLTDDIPEVVDEEPDIGGVPPDELMKMISRLPASYRTVLNLFVFEQYSHREIALQLGIKENTSSSIFFRAKRMLSKMIQEYIKQQEI